MPRAQDARERPACDPQGCGECRKGALSARDLIQENADPTARSDLERWLNRLVPENDSLYQHTLEGADDMPAHIKAALTAVSLSIPVVDGRLALGTWQGIYLWEHRHQPGRREVVVHLAG